MEQMSYSPRNSCTGLLELELMMMTIKSKENMTMLIYLRRTDPGQLYAQNVISRVCVAIIAAISVFVDSRKVTLCFAGFSPRRRKTS
jgi:hypothetical protein